MIIGSKKFSDKKQALKYLAENRNMLIDAKKAEVKMKTGIQGFYNPKTGTIKEIPNKDDDYIYPVISNTNYLDSHDDVHLNGSMKKTAKEQNHKVYYLADHKLEVDSVIASPKNVEIQLLTLPWSDLGRNYKGKTEALVFKIAKDKIKHDKFKRMIEEGEDLQNSIRMQYVKLGLGINDANSKESYAYWKKHYDSIVNKDSLNERGFFFGIEELKIFLEGSAVLFGSNDATPVKGAEIITPNPEPSIIDTQIQSKLNELLKKTRL